MSAVKTKKGGVVLMEGTHGGQDRTREPHPRTDGQTNGRIRKLEKAQRDFRTGGYSRQCAGSRRHYTEKVKVLREYER